MSTSRQKALCSHAALEGDAAEAMSTLRQTLGGPLALSANWVVVPAPLQEADAVEVVLPAGG